MKGTGTNNAEGRERPVSLFSFHGDSQRKTRLEDYWQVSLVDRKSAIDSEIHSTFSPLVGAACH
jgi:hypothetical protein